jgi:pyridine nucleotide-disulfide oxidoreductase family protein
MSDAFDLLLLGAGHAHLGVLRLWAGGQRPAGRIALVSDGPHAWYSGMLPGLLAGRYRPEQCRVPLQGLCAAADVLLMTARLVALEPSARRVSQADGRCVSAAWLSLGVGSQPLAPEATGSEMTLLPVKPFAAFLEGWDQWRQAPQPLAILGGGAAGVELALALGRQVPALTLLSAGQLLAGHPASLRRRALRHLAEAGVAVREGTAVDAVQGDALLAGDQVAWRGRRVILATGAAPLPWLRKSGLACDERGFIRIGDTLQSLSHPQLFANGDCASLARTPRNGVYAVRQAPVLAANLAAALQHRPLQPFVPQRHALALLADGRGGALMSWAGVTCEGALAGWWKDRLDRRFIERHRIGSPIYPTAPEP